MSEEYSIGYSEGYQAGWNEAMDATPPVAKRQPLTADQINQAWSQALNTADPTGGQLPFIFTRCIEALHHIAIKPN